MKKKLIAILLTAVILLPMCCSNSTHATSAQLNLTFSGTVANCHAVVNGSSNIQATLELWQGNTMVCSWSSSGSFRIEIDEHCDVLVDYVYTLKLYGTIGGVSFQEQKVTRRNWGMNK